MVNRIKQIIDYSQLSTSAFADTIGISRSGLTHLLTGRNQPSLDVARKILAKFPEISTEWLIMGMGDMIRIDNQNVDNQKEIKLEENESSYPPENQKIDTQTDLFGEYDTSSEREEDDEKEDFDVENEGPDAPELFVSEAHSETSPVAASAPVPSRERKQPSATPARRERRSVAATQERKLQKIVFFYDDHSFEVYNNI